MSAPSFARTWDMRGMYETDPGRRRAGIRWVITIVVVLVVAILAWIILWY